jgi:hypothetical protein
MFRHLTVLRLLSGIFRLDLVGFSSQVELVYCFFLLSRTNKQTTKQKKKKKLYLSYLKLFLHWAPGLSAGR